MRILGIDPGFGRVGWGVVIAEKGDIHTIGYGTIETSTSKNHAQRLKEVYTAILTIIDEYTPEEVAVEEIFFSTNVKTAIQVAQGRGVILLAAENSQLPLYEYTPQEAKIAITGYGNADKKQIGVLVKKLLRLEQTPKVDDTADALAIAITHAYSRKMKIL